MFGFKSKATEDSRERQAAQSKPGLFKRLREKLNRGDSWLTYDLANLLPGGRIDDTVLDELETRLITADVGVETTERILDELRKQGRAQGARRSRCAARGAAQLAAGHPAAGAAAAGDRPHAAPFAILVVGVNGAGKTTTIGKLARQLQAAGPEGDARRRRHVPRRRRRAAADLGRAQRRAGDRAGRPAPIPPRSSSMRMQAAQARGIDVLLADTAGRLHTQSNLMDELKKVKRVMGRVDARAPHEVLLVLDASQGQNALQQARLFNEALGVTGIVLTKLDGTAKGGIVLAIASELRLPIRYHRHRRERRGLRRVRRRQPSSMRCSSATDAQQT